MGKAWIIKDARGSAIELWHGGGPEHVFDQLEVAERKHFTDQIMPASSAMAKLLLYVATVIVVSVVMALLFALLKPAAWPSYLAGVFVGTSVAAMSIAYFRFQLRSVQRNPKYVGAMLGINRCPACLYQLEGQQVSSDGCVVCPECGGAWRKLSA